MPKQLWRAKIAAYTTFADKFNALAFEDDMTTFGTPGNDTISTALNDVFALDGDDLILANGNDLMLHGGAGSDTLDLDYTIFNPTTAQLADLRLVGGSEDDLIEVNTRFERDLPPPFPSFSSNVVLDGGGGDDTLALDQRIDTGSSYSGVKANATVTIRDTAGHNTVSIKSGVFADDDISLQNTSVVLGNGADTVTMDMSGDGLNFSSESNHDLSLGAGADSLTLSERGGFFTSYMDAGNGNDTLDSAFVMDSANVAGAGLTLVQDLGSGNDSSKITVVRPNEYGSADAIFLLGSGNDTLGVYTTQYGTWSVFGDRGNNDITVDGSGISGYGVYTPNVVNVQTEGGRDKVALDGAGYDQLSTANVSTGFGNDTILSSGFTELAIDAGGNDDLIQVTTEFNENLTGGGVTNTVSGGSGDDSISVVDTSAPGGLSSRLQFIDGGGGNDTIFSRIDGTGSQTVDGGGGDDLITVRLGQTNTINGGAGRDTIDASTGADTIDGGGGNDIINGRGGDDKLTSGAGADTFVYNVFANFGADTITDWNRAVDIFDFNVADSGPPGLADDIDALVTITDLGTTVEISFDATGASITVDDTSGTFVTSIGDLVDNPLTQII